MTTPPRRHGRGLSLWLCPDPTAAPPYQTLMADLNTEHGGPPFQPHITLLSGLTGAHLTARTRQLASVLAPFFIETTAPDWGRSWFQCVYLRVTPTPSLLQARAAACSIFGHPPDAQFHPHLSLLYSDMAEPDRAALCHRIQAPASGFTVHHIQLVQTIGPTEEWVLRGRHPLGSSQAS